MSYDISESEQSPSESRKSLAQDARCVAIIVDGAVASGAVLPGAGADNAAQEAEQGAYQTLMRKYWKLVMVMVTAQVSDPREAEDIAQEAFIRAFRSMDQLKSRQAFLGWLLRIARNIATDHLRSRRNTLSLDAITDDATGRSGFAPRAALHSTGEGARKLDVEETRTTVLAALQGLPEKYREVVALKYLQGLDGRTMARMLGEPEGTIRNRLFRALKKLRDILQETHAGPKADSEQGRAGRDESGPEGSVPRSSRREDTESSCQTLPRPSRTSLRRQE